MPLTYQLCKNGTRFIKLNNVRVGLIKLLDIKELGGYISYLFVYPKYQNQGIGSQALRDTLAEFSGEGVSLYVKADNQSAIRFYKRHGFFICCTTNNKNKHYLMAKQLVAETLTKPQPLLAMSWKPLNANPFPINPPANEAFTRLFKV